MYVYTSARPAETDADRFQVQIEGHAMVPEDQKQTKASRSVRHGIADADREAGSLHGEESANEADPSTAAGSSTVVDPWTLLDPSAAADPSEDCSVIRSETLITRIEKSATANKPTAEGFMPALFLRVLDSHRCLCHECAPDYYDVMQNDGSWKRAKMSQISMAKKVKESGKNIVRCAHIQPKSGKMANSRGRM